MPGAWEASRSLEPTRRRDVVWDENSLTYQDRVKPPPGFTLSPIQIAKETIYFRQEDAGTLTYRASYWELSEGQTKVLTECTLSVATSGDWAAVGFDSTNIASPENAAPTDHGGGLRRGKVERRLQPAKSRPPLSDLVPGRIELAG